MRLRIHLICNAHLDPVWQWRWEEGASEAISTFRTAADILNEHPGLVFCHNEAVLYRWVERLDPALFREIRRLVRAGRWAISGGWFLQPDANLPGIESLIRQIEEGRTYFRDKFGAVPRVAYNFDSFGHGGGLPQVLRLAGYELYIFMRPQESDRSLPSGLFRWRGVDGSVIPAYRLEVGLYHTEYGNIEERLAAGVDLALKRGRDVPVFWGIGDHGGGATRADLEKIDAFIAREKRVRILHSTPERFWRSVRAAAKNAPIVEGDLQRCFPGCYTSLSRIKRAEAENLGGIVQAESQRAATWWLFGQKYPDEKFAGVWRSHLFNDFHDILPGSCVESAERDALDLYGKAAAEARMLKLEAAAAWAQTCGDRAEIPLTVLNANPALRRMPVEAEFMIEHRPKWTGTWSVRLKEIGGGDIVCQEEQPEALLPFNGWRRKIVFLADLPGVGAAFYKVIPEEHNAGEVSAYPNDIRESDADLWIVGDGFPPENKERSKGKENEWNPGFASSAAVPVGRRSGLLESLRIGGVDCLDGGAPRAIVLDDPGDSWGTDGRSYRDVVGEFEPASPTRIVERGPVRTILESERTCLRSRLVLSTIIYPTWPVVEFRLRLLWNEERKRLILVFPTALKAGDILCGIPGGAIRRPADGEEHVHGRWCALEGALEGKPAAFGIAHPGFHGIGFRDGEIRLSVLRSSAYCHEQGFNLRSDRAYRFADQGLHEIRLAVTAGKPKEIRGFLAALSDYLTAPPAVYAHLPFGGNTFKKRKGAASVSSAGLTGLPAAGFLSVSVPNVRLLTCRRSADGKALLVRFQESAGRKTKARVTIDHPAGAAGEPIVVAARFNPYEMKTFRVGRSGIWRISDLIDGGPGFQTR
jgi:alpha-mannosidase